MNDFEVDGRIQADCHDLGKWGHCRLMLHRDATVRWFIIVPETEVSEWHDLPRHLQQEILEMTSALGGMLKAGLSCDKVNIAAIGNVVPQFHFHVIGRWRTDPHWPGVVWGRSSMTEEYSSSELDDIERLCRQALSCLAQPSA